MAASAEVTQTVIELIAKLKVATKEKLPLFPSEISELLNKYSMAIGDSEITGVTVRKKKEA